MKIVILVEGKTEQAFKPYLILYLQRRLAGKMPKLRFIKYDGRVPSKIKLQKTVRNLLDDGRNSADAVIALTDVYTGTDPPVFPTAEAAKQKMREWVGPEPRFHPHAALHDFEAWLLPYWAKIQKLTGCNLRAPRSAPEKVNHGNPPSRRLAEAFRLGPRTGDYVKGRDVGRILKDEDLSAAVDACPELKAFVDCIVGLCR